MNAKMRKKFRIYIALHVHVYISILEPNQTTVSVFSSNFHEIKQQYSSPFKHFLGKKTEIFG